MTGVQMKDYFLQLLDKGSAYFTDAEIFVFINQSILEYINRSFPSNEGGVVNIEVSQPIIDNFSSLIEVVGSVSVAAGVVTIAEIESVSERTYYKLLSLGVGDKSIKFVRHNDWHKFKENSFKKPSLENPKFRYITGGFLIEPTFENVEVAFVATPNQVAIDTTSDMPVSTHKRIVEMAVQLASVSLREGGLIELVNANQVSGSGRVNQ